MSERLTVDFAGERRRRESRRLHALLALATALTTVFWGYSPTRAADERPRAYTLPGPPSNLDAIVRQYYGKLYKLTRIDDEWHHVGLPRGPNGFGPTRETVHIDGQCISGQALILFIVTDQGAVESMLTVGVTRPELEKLALGQVAKTRWQPATLDGKPVAVVYWLQFVFTCP